MPAVLVSNSQYQRAYPSPYATGTVCCYLKFSSRTLATALFVISYPHDMIPSTAVCVLGMSEILEVVTEQLSYHDLAIFAQVAQVVSDPCLNVLWKRLPTAFPLLALIPSVTKSNGCYILNHQRCITENEWKVFDKYAQRVHLISRQFSSTSRGPTDIEFSIYQKMQDLRRRPLFPRLNTLSIPVQDMAIHRHDSCENPTTIEVFLMNLSPFILATLIRVNVLGHLHENCRLTYEIINTLSKTSLCLHHLRVDYSLDSQILEPLRNFSQLKIFDLGFDSQQPYQRRFIGTTYGPDVYTTLFKTISSLSNLSTLLINYENGVKTTFTSHPPISNLLRLAIKASRCHIIIPIFHVAPNLTMLCISVWDLRLQDMEELGSTLLSCPSLNNLEVGSYHISFPSTSNSHPIMIDFVRPLKNLRLQVLVLECRTLAEIEVSHSMLCEIGRSFPEIRKLYLFSTALSTGSSFVPVDIGMAMAQLCPSLIDFRTCCPLPTYQDPIPLALFQIENTFHINCPILTVD